MIDLGEEVEGKLKIVFIHKVHSVLGNGRKLDKNASVVRRVAVKVEIPVSDLVSREVNEQIFDELYDEPLGDSV